MRRRCCWRDVESHANQIVRSRHDAVCAVEENQCQAVGEEVTTPNPGQCVCVGCRLWYKQQIPCSVYNARHAGGALSQRCPFRQSTIRMRCMFKERSEVVGWVAGVVAGGGCRRGGEGGNVEKGR